MITDPWLALYVKPRHEKHVANALSSKGYKCFLPTYVKKHAHSKRYELPLFPCYVFCRTAVTGTLEVKKTPGVFSIVGDQNGPLSVSEEELDQVRALVHSGLVLHLWPYLNLGDRIEIDSGPLHGTRGIVVDLSKEKWLVVSVHILERSVAVKLDRASLEEGSIQVRKITA